MLEYALTSINGPHYSQLISMLLITAINLLTHFPPLAAFLGTPHTQMLYSIVFQTHFTDLTLLDTNGQ